MSVQYTRGCAVQRGMIHTPERYEHSGVVKYTGGYHDKCGGRSLGKQLNLYGNCIPRCTHDIPHTHHGIPPVYSWYPPSVLMVSPSALNTPTVLMISPTLIMVSPGVLMVSPHCTEHPRVLMISPQCIEHPPVYAMIFPWCTQ